MSADEAPFVNAMFFGGQSIKGQSGPDAWLLCGRSAARLSNLGAGFMVSFFSKNQASRGQSTCRLLALPLDCKKVIGLAYHDDMTEVRRKLLDRCWPQIRPAVSRMIREQNGPLSMNQYEAVRLWLQEDFHLGTVDRVYLDLLIKNTEAAVLYGRSSSMPVDRYITVADCEGMTALQFCRVMDHLFVHFGYQVTRKGEQWLVLARAGRPGAVVYLEVRNLVIHQEVINRVLAGQKQRGSHKSIIVTTGRFGPDIMVPPSESAMELWDADRLGALLDRIHLTPAHLLD